MKCFSWPIKSIPLRDTAHNYCLHRLLQADEEDLQGGIELDGDDMLFNQAIDDFIQVRDASFQTNTLLSYLPDRVDTSF